MTERLRRPRSARLKQSRNALRARHCRRAAGGEAIRRTTPPERRPVFANADLWQQISAPCLGATSGKSGRHGWRSADSSPG
jgi:hypothetical protein